MVYTINRTLPTHRPLPRWTWCCQCYWQSLWSHQWPMLLVKWRMKQPFSWRNLWYISAAQWKHPLDPPCFWGKFFHSDGFDRFLPHDPKTFKCSHRHLQMKVKSCISLGVAVFYIPTNTLWIIMNHDWLVSIKIGFPVENENLLALDTGWSRMWFPEKKMEVDGDIPHGAHLGNASSPSQIINWLVVWNIIFHILGIIHPNWLSYFSEG